MNSFLLSQPSKTQWQGEVLTLDAAAPTLVFQSSFSRVDVWSYLSNAWSEIWTTAQNNAAGLDTSPVLGSISLYLTVQMHPRILWSFFYLYPTKWGQISQVLFDLNSERRIWNSFQDTPHPGWGLGGEGDDQCYQLLPKAPGQSLSSHLPKGLAVPWQLMPAQPHFTELCPYPGGKKGSESVYLCVHGIRKSIILRNPSCDATETLLV